MVSSILFWVPTATLAALILIAVLLFRVASRLEKVEMLWDVLRDSDSRLKGILEKLTETEDHLRTINKNVYIIARQIIQQEEDQGA